MDSKENGQAKVTDIDSLLRGLDEPLQQEAPQQDRDEGEKPHKYPTGPGPRLINKVLGAGKDGLETMPEKWGPINHDQNMEIFSNGKGRRVISQAKDSSITLELGDIEKLDGYNKGVRKMFDFILIKMNEQAYSGQTLIHDYVSFSLADLIKAGLYGTPQSARRGFKDAMSVITSLKIGGEIRKSKKEAVSQACIEVLFTGIHLKNGECTVYLNPRINWGFVTPFYTVLPSWCFRLSNNAYILLQHIFYLARQNTKAISDKGYFTVSIRGVHAALNLPAIEGTTHPQRDIIDAIEGAISDIELLNNDSDFTITPRKCDNVPIQDYINNGYLEIGLKGKYSFFVELAQNTARKIEAGRKRRQKIKDEAIVRKLSKAQDNE